MSDENKIEETPMDISDERDGETTAARIALIRKKSGLSQEEFAKRIMVTRAAVSKWENGGGMPSVDSCQIIAREFDVSIDYILGVSDNPFSSKMAKLSFTEPKTGIGKFFAKAGFCAAMVSPIAVLASLSWTSEGVDFSVPFTCYVTFPLLFVAIMGVPFFGALKREWKFRASLISWIVAAVAICVLSMIFAPPVTYREAIFPEFLIVPICCAFIAFLAVLVLIGVFRYKKLKRMAAESEDGDSLEESVS